MFIKILPSYIILQENLKISLLQIRKDTEQNMQYQLLKILTVNIRRVEKTKTTK